MSTLIVFFPFLKKTQKQILETRQKQYPKQFHRLIDYTNEKCPEGQRLKKILRL